TSFAVFDKKIKAYDSIAEEKRIAKAKIEKERTDRIDTMLGALDGLVNNGQAFNLSAENIQQHLKALEEAEISAVDFQEKTEMAEMVKASGIETLTNLLASREKWEAEQAEQAAKLKADQAEAARVKEEQAEIAKANELKEKELEKKQAAFDALEAKTKADQKKKDDEAAEKIRKQVAQLEAGRKALEKEKADIAAKKYSDMYDSAEWINMVIVNDSAVKMNADFDLAKAQDDEDLKEKL
ncbi:unnamed protein product, partial [marine sediment metagenome]